jgi:manganese/iron transport system ATP-binding protein
VLIKQTIIAQGLTNEVFTQENLQKAFGGVLRHFVLAGEVLHKDDDARQVTILSDDERPVVLYGEQDNSHLSSQLNSQAESTHDVVKQ